MVSVANGILNRLEGLAVLNDEEDPWSTFSIAVYLLIPVVALIVLWGRKDIRSRLLLQLDRNCISVFCPSLSKREKLLKWASGRLPENWSSHLRTLSGGIGEFWNDGSLLCTLINTAVPGACPNPHRHWKKPPIHAQIVAHKYLGVDQNFTDKDLSGKLTMIQERRFIQYLYQIYMAMSSLQSAKDFSDAKFSHEYVARGMGLYAGERYRKTTFYLYPNKRTRLINHINISIRGPYTTYGKTEIKYPCIIPHISINDSKNKKMLKESRNTSIFRSFNLGIGPFLNKEALENNNDIPIDVEFEQDRIRVSYIPKNFGMYEILIFCDGEVIPGTPYNIHIVNSTTDKCDSFDEETDNKKKPERKVKRLPKITPVQEKPSVDFSSSYDIPTLTVEEIIDVPQETGKILDVTPEKVMQFSGKSKNFINQIENNNKLKSAVDEDKCVKSFVGVSEIQTILASDADPKINNPECNNSKINSSQEDSVEKKTETSANTSPICPDHIVPEVPKRKLTLSEKRKSFRKQDSVEDLNSTFSFPENESNSKSSLDEWEIQEEKSYMKREISTARSLPNISSSSPENKQYFSKNRAFWETLSTSSSGSFVNITRCTSRTPTKSITFKENLCKSSDDLSKDIMQHQEIKSFKSIDNSLDYCTIFSIEERKQFLLKNEYEKEKMKSRSLKKLNVDNNKYNNTDVLNSRVQEDEKNLYNHKHEDEDKAIQIRNNNFIQNDLEIEHEGKLKTHFKKSIQYFKNLEKSITKTKPKDETNPAPKVKRRTGSLKLSQQLSKFTEFFGKSEINGGSTYPRIEGISDDFKKSRKSVKSLFDVY